MLQKSQAIILHTLKYGDSSLIVQSFTREWGRTSFLLKGARKTKKGSKASLFQPLSVLELDVYFKDGRDMQWIKEANSIGLTPGFGGNIVKSTQALFICELLVKTLREAEENASLFEFLYYSIGILNNPEYESASFHLLFMFELTKYLGHFPNNNFSERNCYFDLAAGGFSDLSREEDLTLQAELGSIWNACFQTGYTSVDQVFINQKRRNIFLDSLLEFYQLHYPLFGHLNSLEVLRSIFDE